MSAPTALLPCRQIDSCLPHQIVANACEAIVWLLCYHKHQVICRAAGLLITLACCVCDRECVRACVCACKCEGLGGREQVAVKTCQASTSVCFHCCCCQTARNVACCGWQTQRTQHVPAYVILVPAFHLQIGNEKHTNSTVCWCSHEHAMPHDSQ